MTKITLRKSSALQAAIEDLIHKVKVKNKIELNEWQDPAAELVKANERMLADDTRRNDLLMALYSLRSQVAVANATSGISNRLSHAAYIDRRIKDLESLVEDSEQQDTVEILAGKLEKIRQRPADSRASIYGRDDTVSTGIMSADNIASIRGVIADLKKQKRSLNDEVLELNVRTEIELPDSIEAILAREKLL